HAAGDRCPQHARRLPREVVELELAERRLDRERALAPFVLLTQIEVEEVALGLRELQEQVELLEPREPEVDPAPQHLALRGFGLALRERPAVAQAAIAGVASLGELDVLAEQLDLAADLFAQRTEGLQLLPVQIRELGVDRARR